MADLNPGPYDERTTIHWYQRRWGSFKRAFVVEALETLLRTLRRLDIADTTFAFKFTPNELHVLKSLHATLTSDKHCTLIRFPLLPDRADYPSDLLNFDERWVIPTDVDLAAAELGASVSYSKLFSARHPDRIAYTARTSDARGPADEIDAINVVIHYTRTTAFANK